MIMYTETIMADLKPSVSSVQIVAIVARHLQVEFHKMEDCSYDHQRSSDEIDDPATQINLISRCPTKLARAQWPRACSAPGGVWGTDKASEKSIVTAWNR